MNQTTNYKLNLPEGRDVADISKLNENFTKLDSTIKTVDNRVTTVDNRVTTVDTRVTTVNSNLTSSINTVNTNLTSSINSTKTSLTSSINNVSTQRKPVTGTYTGNGSASRSFSLGFQPSLVIVSSDYGLWSERAAIAISGCPVGYPDTLLSVTSTGFTVYYDSNALTNMADRKYFYAAWR